MLKKEALLDFLRSSEGSMEMLLGSTKNEIFSTKL